MTKICSGDLSLVSPGQGTRICEGGQLLALRDFLRRTPTSPPVLLECG